MNYELALHSNYVLCRSIRESRIQCGLAYDRFIFAIYDARNRSDHLCLCYCPRTSTKMRTMAIIMCSQASVYDALRIKSLCTLYVLQRNVQQKKQVFVKGTTVVRFCNRNVRCIICDDDNIRWSSLQFTFIGCSYLLIKCDIVVYGFNWHVKPPSQVQRRVRRRFV